MQFCVRNTTGRTAITPGKSRMPPQPIRRHDGRSWSHFVRHTHQRVPSIHRFLARAGAAFRPRRNRARGEDRSERFGPRPAGVAEPPSEDRSRLGRRVAGAVRFGVGMKGAGSFGEGGRSKDHSEPARRERRERLDNASEDRSESPDSNGPGAFEVFAFLKPSSHNSGNSQKAPARSTAATRCGPRTSSCGAYLARVSGSRWPPFASLTETSSRSPTDRPLSSPPGGGCAGYHRQSGQC